LENPKVVAVDFDGTLVVHKYPDIGDEVPWGFIALGILQSLGVKVILYTMRSDLHLEEALEYCRREYNLDFWGVNHNPDQRVWTTSNKVYAHVYIDDAAIGVPLMLGPNPGDRPMVNWRKAWPEICARLGLPLVPMESYFAENPDSPASPAPQGV
jgi:hypothetical protein